MKEKLTVYFKNKLAGFLLYEKGELFFHYDESYLADNNNEAISFRLPLVDKIFKDVDVRPFFDGILPEDAIRKQIAKLLKTDSRNTFVLLKRIGGDCAGAVSVFEENKYPETIQEEYRVVLDDEAYDILSSLKVRPLYIGEDDFRISGAGAQDKLIACIKNGQLVLPLNGTPSTHIIKPNIAGYEDTVFNELFCMKLADACGLKTAECFVKKIKDKSFYVVKRYDRKQMGDLWVRIHQEDFCQARGILSENKYESDGGPSLSDCFNILNSYGFSGADKIAFLDLIIFNYLIGNCDAHGKNFSILYKGEIPELAPAYDLMCTVILFPFYDKIKMAMKLGGSNYLISKINRNNFEKLADIFGYREDFILKRLDMLSSKILNKANELAIQLNSNNETCSPVYEKIIKVIEKHVMKIKE